VAGGRLWQEGGSGRNAVKRARPSLVGVAPSSTTRPSAHCLCARLLKHPVPRTHVRVHTHAPCPTQARMASTSNQETFRCSNLNGRLVFDVLRQVDTTQAKVSFYSETDVLCSYNKVQQ